MIVVRHAVLADADEIGDAHAEAWRVAYADLFEPDVLDRAVDDRRKRWPTVMEADWFAYTTLLVAERDGRVQGFAHFGPCVEDPDVGEIYGFYLHPDAWGSGAAAELMREALTTFSSTGCRRVRLWTHPGATRARAFYAKSGFRETGRAQQGDDLLEGTSAPEIEYARSIPNAM